MAKLIYSFYTMEFRIKVELPKNQNEIKHSDQIQLWGSCFADNIGKKLLENKFSCDLNPFGTLYNPMSIASALKELLHNKVYTEQDLCYANGLWFSYMHHSTFSSPDSQKCLDLINSRISESKNIVEKADWIILTWGSAWVYQTTSEKRIVGNCHKMPEKTFLRKRLEIEEIVTEYKELIQNIRNINPTVRFLFTVSPIRHSKDGMHGNQLSKSTLLLAIDALCTQCEGCYYFPSYELMMDELRDYRFYADDMLHPTSLAVDYIWECFANSYFSPATFAILSSWEKIKKGLSHRPFDANSEAHQHFLREILLKIELLKEKMPYLDVENEIKICQAQLKK